MEFEAATKGAQEIVKVESDRDKTAEEVHAVTKRSTDERPGKCFRCGRKNHTAGQCPHIVSYPDPDSLCKHYRIIMYNAT